MYTYIYIYIYTYIYIYIYIYIYAHNLTTRGEAPRLSSEAFVGDDLLAQAINVMLTW